MCTVVFEEIIAFYNLNIHILVSVTHLPFKRFRIVP